MLPADIWPQLPENPTWIFVVCLGIVVGYLLLRAYTANQQVQINGLRESLDKQADRHDRQMREMREQIARLEVVSEEARSERHLLRGEVGKYKFALSIVGTLYSGCHCGALDPVKAVFASLEGEPS